MKQRTYDVERMSFIILLRMQVHRCSYIPNQISHIINIIIFSSYSKLLTMSNINIVSIMHARIASASVHPAFYRYVATEQKDSGYHMMPAFIIDSSVVCTIDLGEKGQFSNEKGTWASGKLMSCLIL
jgi:hypothetical protein